VTTKHPVRSTMVEFDHHSPAMPDKNWETFAQLRANCPVAYTEAHNGFWMISGHDQVQAAARDDDTFSSENDLVTRLGIALPAMPAKAGIIETDPPYFTKLRKAFVPWFSPGAAEARRADVQQITDYCIDQVVEEGKCDLTRDITSPVPGLLTMQFLGFSPADSEPMGDLFHRHSYIPPDTPERHKLDGDVEQLGVQLYQRAAQCREHPREDFLSFLANLETDGELMSLQEVAENAFLVLAGGIDTTTALMSNTLLHLNEHPGIRPRLLADSAFLSSAFDEYLRYYSPVQGLARTITRDCTWAGQALRENDRAWLSWASANHDETAFLDPETIQLDRSPNRHVSFGVGLHRCLGANLAKVTWQTVITSILTRIPDYLVDLAACSRFTTIGVINGWIGTPATFTPGPKVGASLPQ
jgi:cytochrome P450